MINITQLPLYVNSFAHRKFVRFAAIYMFCPTFRGFFGYPAHEKSSKRRKSTSCIVQDDEENKVLGGQEEKTTVIFTEKIFFYLYIAKNEFFRRLEAKKPPCRCHRQGGRFYSLYGSNKP